MEKLQIIGNLTRDPELRVTQSGVNVCTFTVAVNKRLTKAQRDAGQQANAKYFRVTAWRELGENCNKYLAKGRKVYVEGTIDVSVYTSQQDGKPHGSLEMTADNVEFLSGRGDDSAQSAEPATTAPTPAAASAATAGFTQVEDDDDLPF